MTPRKDPRAAMLDRLRAKGLGLAPHMVDGRAVPAGRLGRERAALGASGAVQTPEGPITRAGGSKPADRLTAPGDVFEFTIPAPCEFLNANDSYFTKRVGRKQFQPEKVKKVKAWREAGADAAAAADLPTGVPRLQVDCFVWKPIANDYDPANWAPTAKAVLDGMIDYGLAEDDNRHFVTGPFMHEGGKGADALVVRVTVLASSS